MEGRICPLHGWNRVKVSEHNEMQQKKDPMFFSFSNNYFSVLLDLGQVKLREVLCRASLD